MTDFATILAAAYDAAKAAVVGAEDKGTCGFAWVVIPGTSPLARYCRAKIKALGGERKPGAGQYGSKNYPSGWQFWSPAGWQGQTIWVHEAGATAFAGVLAANGIDAQMHSRVD